MEGYLPKQVRRRSTCLLASLPTFHRPQPLSACVITAVWPRAPKMPKNRAKSCCSLLASQSGSKACALPACLPSVGLPAFSPPRAREPGFLENAFPSDNDILEFITKTWPSWAENRFIETAIPENIPAELSAARNSAIHAPLSHPLSPGLHAAWTTSLARPPNDHASSHAHEAPHHTPPHRRLITRSWRSLPKSLGKHCRRP